MLENSIEFRDFFDEAIEIMQMLSLTYNSCEHDPSADNQQSQSHSHKLSIHQVLTAYAWRK